MNKQLRDEWVKALRSGEYEQGDGRLQKEDAFCCLGVLCLVAEKTGVVEAVREETDDGEKLKGMWLGAQPLEIRREIDPTTVTEVSKLNDTGSTFTEIADWIEANIPVETP